MYDMFSVRIYLSMYDMFSVRIYSTCNSKCIFFFSFLRVDHNLCLIFYSLLINQTFMLG